MFIIKILSSFSQSTYQTSIQNFNPDQALKITGSLVYNDSKSTEISEFEIKWICISEDRQSECKDSKQNQFKSQQQLTLEINPNLLDKNTKYNFYLIVNRLNKPNTQQIASVSVTTAQQLVVNTDLGLIQQVNYNDIIQISLLKNEQFNSQNAQYIYSANIKHKTSQITKQYQSNFNQLSFIFQDLFTDLDLNDLNQFSLSFSVLENSLGSILSSAIYSIKLRQPPSGCQLKLSTQSLFSLTQLSVSGCNLNGQTTKYQFFYYSSFEKLHEEIKTSGAIVNRKMLSTIISNEWAMANLPPGNSILMVVTIGPNNLKISQGKINKRLQFKDHYQIQQKVLPSQTVKEHFFLQLREKKLVLQLAPNKNKQQNFTSCCQEDQKIRYIFIMQTFQSQYMPSLFNQDIDQQMLFIKLGLCNLFSLKQGSINNNYRFSDQFTYQALFNIINTIELLFSFKDPQSGELKPKFHSDIKPQNIILTAKKENVLQISQVQLLQIDYGGASIEIQDYWTYYTPAFVSNKLWSKFVNDQNYQEKLQWEEIRFDEVYAACRSIQYINIGNYIQGQQDQQTQYLEQKGRIDSIIVNSYAKQEQNLIKNRIQEQNLLATKRFIQSQPCNVLCVSCSYYCEVCSFGRELPNCDCRSGFYSQSQYFLSSCQQCGENCKLCQDQNTCQTCNDKYKLVNNQCIWDTSFDGLYFTTQVGADLASIVITFNQIIGIKKTSTTNISNGFSLSYDNCSILNQDSQKNYGVFEADFGYGGCYIRQSLQTQFIIKLTSNLVSDNLLNVPEIDSSQILIFNGIPIYKSLQQGVTATTTENQIGQHLSQIPKICQFQQQIIVASLSQQTLSIAITTVLPFLFFSVDSGNIYCLVEYSDFPSMTFNPCSDAQGLVIPTKQFQDQNQVLMSVKCTFLGYTTKDFVNIIFTSSNAQKITAQYQKLFFSSFFKDTFEFQVSFFSDSLLNQIQTSYHGYTQINLSSSCQLLSESYNCTLQILGTSVMTEQVIIIQMFAYTQNLATAPAPAPQTAIQFFVQYLSSFSLDVDQKQISNFFPSKSLTIKASLIDNNYQPTDVNQFSFYWYCMSEDTQTQCKDRNQNVISLQSSLTVQISPYTFNLNGKFSIYIIAKRLNQPNTQQIAITYLDTGQTSFKVATDMSTLEMINYQDIIFVELQYQTNLYSTNQTCTYKAIILNSVTQAQKIYESISNKLSFIIQDLFPNLDLTIQNNLLIQFSVQDSTINETLSSHSYSMKIIQPPYGCKLSLSSQSPFEAMTISVNSCNLNGQVTQYQFFYYSSLEQYAQEINTSGTIVNRKMLSLITQSSQAVIILPPGNIVVMVLTIGPNNQRSNFTQTVTIQGNNFNQIEYEKYLQNRYNLAQMQSSKSIKIFEYQNITNAVEYYESKNINYTPSDSINQLKNQILQQLADPSWQNEDKQVQLLSIQINVRLKQSKMQISSNTSQAFVNANEKQIQNILQASSLQLNNQQRQYYQEILTSLAQDYMKNLNNLNDWSPNNSLNSIQQSNNIMIGIAQTMFVNQQPIQVITEGVSLLVDRVDYIALLSKYYDNSQIVPEQSQFNQSYYVLVQTWPNTHPLYRDELKQINQQYYSNSTSEQLNLLQKTYPIIIPNILEDGKRRRQLSTTIANLPGPFQLQFPTQDEKLECIQKNINGKWVSNSCKTSIKFVNKKRTVNCSCQIPGPTSIITDITQLFDNNNIQDIFNGEGFMRIFHLNNWYEYAPIWTIILLNIFFIALLVIGHKYDKIDKVNDLKKAFLIYNSKVGQSPTNGQKNLFIQIKNYRTTQNKLSINPVSQINTQKTQEQFEDQEANYNNNNNKINLEHNKKSIFVEGDKMHSINLIGQKSQKTPINSSNSDHFTSVNCIQQQKKQDVLSDNQQQQLDNQTRVLSEKAAMKNQINFENVLQTTKCNKSPQEFGQEQNQNDEQKKFEENSLKGIKKTTPNEINQENLNSQYKIPRINFNENKEEKQKDQLNDFQDIKNQSHISSDFQKIDEKEDYQQNAIQNFEFKIQKQFKKDDFYIYEEQDYSIYSSNLDKKFEGQHQSGQFQYQITPENQVNFDNNTPNIEDNKTPCIDQNNKIFDIKNSNTPQIDKIASQLETQVYQIQQIDIQKLFTQEEEDCNYIYPTPQPNNKAEHNFLLKDDQIQLVQLAKQEENILQTKNQDSNIQQRQQITRKINNNYSDEEAIKIAIDQKDKNTDLKISAQNLKEQKKLEQKRLFLEAKEKLQLYLQKETTIRAVLAYHMFFQTFIVYDTKVSRVLRFTIYYNRLIWLLTINSVFGVKLSVVQVLVLSVVSTIIIQIVTIILTLLYFKKKLQIFGVIITSLFLLFCYYSILVVISGQQPYDANMWIISYFSTLFLSDYVYGLGICFAMFYLSKKYIERIQNPLYLNILGSALLIQAFQN
ncbi:hypothetical protein ABPG72_022611 [Tetrahymena utriculariae]